MIRILFTHSLRKYIVLTAAALFFVWILPLGVFIRPEKEKETCDGQRAICLCTHLIAHTTTNGKTLLKVSGSSVEKENAPSASHHFLVIKLQHRSRPNPSALTSDNRTYYSLLVTRPIDHVPKSDVS